jgi:deferrochelatase/peroxidase EfeB
VTIDLDDVQGNVLRAFGRKYRAGRHFFLGVADASAARRFIGALALHDGGEAPFVHSSAPWPEGAKPDSVLNVALTWLGLQALGVPSPVLDSFPQAFRDGPAVRAQVQSGREGDVGLGDVGESAPAGWLVGGPRTAAIHLVVSLFAKRQPILDDATRTLRARFAAGRLTEHASHDAHLLEPPDYVHFGYRDGIAQPQIDGGPGTYVPDSQPKMPVGDLLLGRHYVNSFQGNWAGDLPAALADNATYGAFRILSQDVRGFEALLARWGHDTGLPEEWVAAKIMGRWRNGSPLVLSPDEPSPPPPGDEINDFDYVPTGCPPGDGDLDGLKCPIGAHIRRLNPRGAPVMGMPHSHRLVRRNMPYGPAYDDRQPDDAERGLIGYFLCGDLETQWEFMQRVWANDDFSTPGVQGTREPVVGSQLAAGGSFTIPRAAPAGPCVLGGLRNLVRTRGSLYCLLPGIGGLRYLAAVSDPKGQASW